MNFLALANRLKRKCRVPGAQMTDVTGQVEEFSRLIDWINEAWMDIQLSRENWLWMRASASCHTLQGQALYSPTADFNLTDFGNWDEKTFRNYLTSVGVIGEIMMDPISYDEWRDTYQFGATRVAYSRPTVLTIAPSLSVGLGCVPLTGYTITGDYFRVASELVAKLDTPLLPPQFHMLIVYRAMMHYGISESSPEFYEAGKADYTKMMRLLVNNQLESITVGGALA